MSVEIFHSKIDDKLGVIVGKYAYYYKVAAGIGQVVKVEKTTIPYENICSVITGKHDGDEIKKEYAKGVLDTLVGKRYYYKNWYGKVIYLDPGNGCIHFVNDFLTVFHRINITEPTNTEKAFLMLLDIYGL